MRIVLLAASAALAALAAAAPAEAQSSTAGAFVGVPAVNVHRGGADFHFRRDFDRRRHQKGLHRLKSHFEPTLRVQIHNLVWRFLPLSGIANGSFLRKRMQASQGRGLDGKFFVIFMNPL